MIAAAPSGASSNRYELLQTWTRARFPGRALEFSPASADASFRRYFRARDANASYIVMDAPPQKERCEPFVHVAKLFRAAGVNVPEVLAADLEQGFLLLTDLGSQTYLQALTETSAYNADTLYRAAFAALVRIQQASTPHELPLYDEELLLRELNLFPDWYIARHIGVTLSAAQQASLSAAFRLILDNNLAQPRVYVHRDYHSRNLMVCEPNPGILDFQDAVHGPITYDAVSLLKDAYISWDEKQSLNWLIRYWEAARQAGLPVASDFGHFYRDYEWMGVQRHIKVLGIFARLYHRDGKDGYLKDMPLVMRYLVDAVRRYRELAGLYRLLQELAGQGSGAALYSF